MCWVGWSNSSQKRCKLLPTKCWKKRFANSALAKATCLEIRKAFEDFTCQRIFLLPNDKLQIWRALTIIMVGEKQMRVVPLGLHLLFYHAGMVHTVSSAVFCINRSRRVGSPEHQEVSLAHVFFLWNKFGVILKPLDVETFVKSGWKMMKVTFAEDIVLLRSCWWDDT